MTSAARAIGARTLTSARLSCRSRARAGRAGAATGPRRPSWRSAASRPALGQPDDRPAQRLGRERHRLAPHVPQPRRLGLARRRAGRARPARRSASRRRRGPCSRPRTRRARACAVPKNTEKRLHVSIAPPQRCVNRTPSSCGNVAKKCWASRPNVASWSSRRGADAARRSGTPRRSRRTGSGRRASAGSSGTGSPPSPMPCRRRQPIDARCSALERLGHEHVVVDRHDVAADRAHERRERARRQEHAARPDAPLRRTGRRPPRRRRAGRSPRVCSYTRTPARTAASRSPSASLPGCSSPPPPLSHTPPRNVGEATSACIASGVAKTSVS